MPKKNGVVTTYSFSIQTVDKIKLLCAKLNVKSQTKLLELLINEKEASINGR